VSRRIGWHLTTLTLAGSLLAVATSCRHESTAYSGDVIEAFASRQIRLVEVLRPANAENPIEVSLGPEPQEACDDMELRVTIFDSMESVSAYLRATEQTVGEQRYEFGDTVGLVRGNVVAATDRRSTCFPEAAVEAALDALP
jgi:hypothetical protein